ncbi:MAG: gamma-glutamyl-gamma-aminobutyrate hydrolase family protein [Acidimicrobiia bacterium]
MTHPLVGVTTWRRRFETYIGNDPLHSLADHYVAAVVDSGMVPILFPAGQSTTEAGRLVAMVDGLVLSGGGDVDPSVYGAPRNRATYGDDPVVDEFEIALVREARAQGKPLLAICRGLQLLNVALGGTLNQEVTSEGGLHTPVQGDPESLNERRHVVRFEPGSILADVYGSQELAVNTLHHQGVERLADDLVVEGSTSDGLIEAVRCPGGWWAVGVQWHPERLDADHHKPLFTAFRHAIEGS